MGLKYSLDTLAAVLRQKGFDAVTEHEFAREVGRKYRFDLAVLGPASKLGGRGPVALEQQGAIFAARGAKKRACPLCGGVQAGAHGTGTGIKRDMAKASLAAVLGWRIVYAEPRDVESGKALELLEAALAAEG